MFASENQTFPPPSILFGPATAIASMNFLPRHPNIRKLTRDTEAIIKGLETLASQPVAIGISIGEDPAAEEKAHAWLDSLRSTVAMLTSTRAKVFERDLARFVRHLAPRYIQAHAAALARLNEWRAAVGFFLGEGDDEALGYRFVPPAPPYAPGPSVELP
jgi:hypothetical protein